MIEKFTAKDIVTIISACRKCDVSTLKLDVLEISFNRTSVNDETDTLLPTQPHAYDLEKFVQAEEEYQDFATDIEKQILLAEDPLAYERLMEFEANEESRNRGTESVLSASRQRTHESHGGDQKQYFA